MNATLPANRLTTTRRQSWRSLLAFVLLFFGIQLGFGLLLDYGPPRFRDPEYGRRLANLRCRVAENPGRPLVLVIGSSRTAMGVRPGILEDSPDRPLIFNFALAGSGPIMELMAFRRALADGIKPAAVVVEYWPAFMREDGLYHEEARLDIARMRLVDRALIREFFRDVPHAETAMRRHRTNPWYHHRRSIFNQLSPRWLPNNSRSEAMFERIDDWGWLPGRESLPASDFPAALQAAASYYVPLFAKYEISPDGDRALRQLIAECRSLNIPAALAYLPESAEFRKLMPPHAAQLGKDYLQNVRKELNVPLIDGRGWVGDDQLPDGFHLMQPGATVFTRQFADAIEATFPNLTGNSP